MDLYQEWKKLQEKQTELIKRIVSKELPITNTEKGVYIALLNDEPYDDILEKFRVDVGGISNIETRVCKKLNE